MADDKTKTYRELSSKYGGKRPTTQKTKIPYLRLTAQYEADLKKSFSNPVKVIAFGDTHDTPTQDKTHLHHIAKYIKDSKPELIVHTGDLWDCVSLCHHVPNSTYKGKFKPSLKDDLYSLEEAVAILTEVSGRRDWHMTLGNHEAWLWQFIDKNPELFGFAQDSFNDIFNKAGWTLYEYGRYVDFGGVNFVHAPMSIMGKPRGGENITKTVCNKSMCDTVFGHTHRFGHLQDPKDGNDVWVTAINTGCTMPDGYRPDYAVGPLGWYYGIVEFTIDQGKIRDVRQVSLEALRCIYE